MPDRRKLALAAKAVVAVALLAVLVENGSLDFSLLIRVVTDPVLAVGTPLVWGLAYVVFAGARWHGLVRAIGGELTYLRACRDVLVNHFFNTTTPVGIAGDLWRVVATDPDRARWPVVAGALGVERLSGLAAILTVGGA
ncbi:MAG: lysylphosphatidylglycerol synthase domain-containing protein, partial [Myxococcota bacterium]